MNFKYRKKPVVIEAFQMTRARRDDNSEWPLWLHQAWQRKRREGRSLYCKDGGAELFINTLEGEYQVTFDDFIIQGIKGEIYPCKPDIFHLTYEKVE